VLNNSGIAVHTINRNRLAVERKSTMYSGVASRLLTKGAKTTDRKIIPPTHATAESRWIETRMKKIMVALGTPYAEEPGLRGTGEAIRRSSSFDGKWRLGHHSISARVAATS
jgi:hypothetical protein